MVCFFILNEINEKNIIYGFILIFKLSSMTTHQTQKLEIIQREVSRWKIAQIGTFSVQNVKSFDEFRANVDLSRLKPAILTKKGLFVQADKK